MPIINIKEVNTKRLIKQFLLHILSKRKLSFEIFFSILIILGIPLNLYNNRFYDNSWTVGEWLISYAGGFVRRGLPGELIHFISYKYSYQWYTNFVGPADVLDSEQIKVASSTRAVSDLEDRAT